MKKGILIVIVGIMIVLLFSPIYDSIAYDYDCDEKSIRELVEKYAQENPQKDVSVMRYRQSTGGIRWNINFSTDENLIGAVVPIWIMSPMFLKDDIHYKNDTFLYRKIIVITDRSENIHRFNYDGEFFSIIFPEKIIVAMPKNSYELKKETYRIHNLSVIGIILFYMKLITGMCVVLIIGRCVVIFFTKKIIGREERQG